MTRFLKVVLRVDPQQHVACRPLDPPARVARQAHGLLRAHHLRPLTQPPNTSQPASPGQPASQRGPRHGLRLAAAAGQRRGGPISRMLRRMQNRSDPIPRCMVREFCVISGSDGHGRFSKQYGIPVQIARNSSLLRVNSRLLMQSSGIGQLQPESALDGGLGTTYSSRAS